MDSCSGAWCSTSNGIQAQAVYIAMFHSTSCLGCAPEMHALCSPTEHQGSACLGTGMPASCFGCVINLPPGRFAHHMSCSASTRSTTVGCGPTGVAAASRFAAAPRLRPASMCSLSNSLTMPFRESLQVQHSHTQHGVRVRWCCLTA